MKRWGLLVMVAVFGLAAVAAYGCAVTKQPHNATASKKAAPSPKKNKAAPPAESVSVAAKRLKADPDTCAGRYRTQPPKPGHNKHYDVAGQSRSFHLLLPDASFVGPRPLLMALHGTNESGRSFIERAELDDFVERGFIVVAPDDAGNGELWPVWDAMRREDGPNADLDLIDSLVQCTAAHFEVDERRLYVGGHSAGGIMTNYVIQRRSHVFAGAIVASGLISMTTPQRAPEMDGTFVLVTWGGDNDTYAGSVRGTSIPGVAFAQQAALTSRFYADKRAVTQARCVADDWGHVWLSPINDHMIDLLLAHPKGAPTPKLESLIASPRTDITCSAGPAPMPTGLNVVCPADVRGCSETCQMLADCGVENETVGPMLAPQLRGLGFEGNQQTACDGCVQRCEKIATTPADKDVLSCIANRAAVLTCGSGIEGALPALEAINVCCKDRSDAAYCADTCSVLLGQPATAPFLGSCVDLVQR